MDDGRLFRTQRQVQFETSVYPLQLLLLVLPLDLPVAVPDAALRFANSRDPRACAIGALRVVEAAPLEIAQRQMGEIQIPHVPAARSCRVAIDTLAKECQLESEAMPVGGFEVAGVVPPFGLEVGMIEMIAGKFVVITGQSGSVLRSHLRQDHQESGETRQSNLHRQTQWERSAPQHAQDTNQPKLWPDRRPSKLREARQPASGSVWSSRTIVC